MTTGSPGTLIAVIDTGVDQTHPELQGNVWTNPGEIPANGVDDDANGYIDDVNGWDFCYNDASPSDVYGHGTHVAGTIAARGNNGDGIAANFPQRCLPACGFPLVRAFKQFPQ